MYDYAVETLASGVIFNELKNIFNSNTTNMLCILFHFNFLDMNGLWLLQYSISKHRDWLNAFFGWNGVKTKCTRFISKHLWHFPMDVLVKNIFPRNPKKSLWWYYYKQNNQKWIKHKHTVDTVVDTMSKVDTIVVRSFISSS